MRILVTGSSRLINTLGFDVAGIDINIQRPRPGEVYNLGGGKANAASLLECVEMIHEASGKRPVLTYTDRNPVGDHICYYSDLGKLRSHFPGWDLTYPLDRIVSEMVDVVQSQQRA